MWVTRNNITLFYPGYHVATHRDTYFKEKIMHLNFHVDSQGWQTDWVQGWEDWDGVNCLFGMENLRAWKNNNSSSVCDGALNFQLHAGRLHSTQISKHVRVRMRDQLTFFFVFFFFLTVWQSCPPSCLSIMGWKWEREREKERERKWRECHNNEAERARDKCGGFSAYFQHLHFSCLTENGSMYQKQNRLLQSNETSHLLYEIHTCN